MGEFAAAVPFSVFENERFQNQGLQDFCDGAPALFAQGASEKPSMPHSQFGASRRVASALR
ncbi:hypothetical protein Z948_1112 [Sulfitobacter donghicola DSW-25 = KCTC 12864 = JCM 14565]|nr:hypothetical protein Z948_1112 [Sulfitobacter donghicola DSW-25 = KCTC 12864 = JCM 14565]